MGKNKKKGMIVGFYEIIWSGKQGMFLVKYINGTEVLFSDPIGKVCYDWCQTRLEEAEEKLEKERGEDG
jgi:hypothetical protein